MNIDEIMRSAQIIPVPVPARLISC